MPYIGLKRRMNFDHDIDSLAQKLGFMGNNPGDLNYVITSLVHSVWKADPKYETVAKLTGVLENVKQEFYRRKAVPYEDSKIRQNGDL